VVSVVLAVPFGYEKDEVIQKLLEGFREMINFCIEKAIESNVTVLCKAKEIGLRGVEKVVELFNSLLPFSVQDSFINTEVVEEESEEGRSGP